MSEEISEEEISEVLMQHVLKVLDTNDVLAEFMETAAARLRNGDNPYRVAHYLEENARALRDSRARVELAIRPGEDDDEPVTNALRAYLGKPTSASIAGCMNVGHNAVDCQAAGIPVNRWCQSCKERALAG